MKQVRAGAGAIWLAVIVTLGGAGRAGAGDTATEFVPEVNAYIKLNDTMRFYLLANLTHAFEEGHTDGELGAHLDVTVKPILRVHLREANWERERYCAVRNLGDDFNEAAQSAGRVREGRRSAPPGRARGEGPTLAPP